MPRVTGLTKIFWNAIHDEFVRGLSLPDGSIRWPGPVELAARHRVRVETLKHRAATHGWVKEREAYHAQVQAQREAYRGTDAMARYRADCDAMSARNAHTALHLISKRLGELVQLAAVPDAPLPAPLAADPPDPDDPNHIRAVPEADTDKELRRRAKANRALSEELRVLGMAATLWRTLAADATQGAGVIKGDSNADARPPADLAEMSMADLSRLADEARKLAELNNVRPKSLPQPGVVPFGRNGSVAAG